MTTQTVALENKIAELHKKLIGQVPSKAEMCYLEKVKWLDMYGVDLHPVLGEDNIEYFLGLTPSGVIVLRNKAKVGNYYWPRISKVYFRGRFFMLRVRDKNNSENTYGFETPSKAACKHLWQCCVEHHAFFRLTQASGNSPAAIFSLGSKFSGRTEKEAVQDAKIGSRTQPEFTRMPSRRYQRRIVEGAQDTPRVEDVEVKPETRNTVQLPTPVSTVSHMYRSTSMTLAPRSDSPRSTRSAPYPASVATSGGTATLLGGRSGEHRPRGESPRSVHSAVSAPQNCVVSRRTSSVDSQSSVDSRGHRRHRRSRGRSSDGESEASSKCSSRGHRRHRHRHHSDDSDHHRHRHRRRRHKSGGSMVNSDAQWAQVQAGEVQVRGNTATVRDLSHKSGYQPSGIDTEADSHHQHSNKKRHRKHRSRSRSPSEAKNTRLPDELRRHLEFDLQKTQGLTEAELKEIPYTKVETAKTIKIKYTSPKTKRHKSPRRSKSNSSDRKATPPADGESPPPPYTPSPTSKTNTLPKASHKCQDTSGEGTSARAPDGGGMVNGTLRPPGPRAVQAPTVAISRVKSSEGLSSLANCSRGSNGDSPGAFRSHNDSGNNIGVMKTSASASTSTSCSSYGFTSSTSHKPVMINSPSVKALVTNSANRASPTLCREASNPDSSAFLEETSGFVAANGFVPTSAAILKNGTNERGSHFTAVLKPQPSPQSSVTSGISVGSSSASTAVVSDANGYPNGSFDCGNTAVPVKFSGLGKTNGSIGGSCMNGNNNSKTCLSLNGHSPKSKVLAPTCDEYIHINSKINSNIKSHLNSFNNGDLNGYETDYINGSLHERVTSPNGGKGIGHMKTFGNGHVSGFFNSHAKDFPNGSMNNSFEIESKNNKNVTFRFDNSLIRNSKGSGINVTVNGKLEDDHLKVKANDEYKGDLKGKLNSEVVDEISTEL